MDEESGKIPRKRRSSFLTAEPIRSIGNPFEHHFSAHQICDLKDPRTDRRTRERDAQRVDELTGTDPQLLSTAAKRSLE